MGEIRTARRPFSWSSIAAFVVEAVAACAFVIAVYEVVVAGGLALLPKPGDNWILVLLVAATAIAGAGMTPVRRRAGALARKVLPAADPTHALRSAVSGAVAAGPAEDALPRLAKLLAEGAGARSATVWQADPPGRLRCAVSWPEGSWADGSLTDGSRADGVGPGTVGDEAELQALADYVAPVRDGGKVIGWLALRAREGGFLVLPDVRLAEDVANAAGLLLRNVELTGRLREQVRVKKAQADELAASRRRLVVAGDAARERLSTEIQARVCEPLERCAEQVEGVLRALDRPAGTGPDDGQAGPDNAEAGPDDGQAGPDNAEAGPDDGQAGPALVAGLAEISAEIDAAIADFRRIVHGVYPPVLTDHGLRAAMETLLAELDPAASLMPPRVARLAPRVEEASYFCADALLRGWQATGAQRPMQVLVGVSSSRIEMTFVDGVTRTPERPASPVSPLVLEEVQDRVAALGGDLQIEDDESGRLLVIAVPLVTADLAAWADGADR